MPFEDCYGSVGEKTYYHRGGKCYYRRRARPGFPGTMAQMEHLAVHLRHNLFVSAYHGFATLGQEHVPHPQPWDAFPPYAIEKVSGAMIEDGMLFVDFDTWLDPAAGDDRYQVLARLQLAKPGGGRDPGKMRSFLSLLPCKAGHSVTGFAIPDYLALWGLDLQEYTIHIRHVLLDRKSGYRSQYLQQSFDFSLP